MKLDLEKTFPMPGGVEAAWSFLQDIEGVAGCMPGAAITERIDERHYKGTVSVKVGPASLSFRGDIEVIEIDAARHAVHLVGKGSDTSGTSGASMDLLARIEPGDGPDASNLIGKSEVSVSGKAAAFGGRMMGSVTEQILKQFAANFAQQVQQRSTPPAMAPVHAEPGAADASGEDAVRVPAPAPARELNAFALLWAMVRDWFRGVFGRRRSA
jgi:carbon monoxide dehydrogenase subunit G